MKPRSCALNELVEEKRFEVREESNYTLQVGRDLIHDEKDDPQQHILEEVVCRVSDSEIHVEKDDPQQHNLEEQVCIVSDAEVDINEQPHKVSRAEFCRASEIHQPETIENPQNTEESNLIAETEIEAPILRPISTPSLLPCQRQNVLISNKNDEHCPVKRRLTIGQKHIQAQAKQKQLKPRSCALNELVEEKRFELREE